MLGGLIMVLVLYATPSLVALGRKRRNAGAVVALNLLLGWTLVGWVVALVWSLTTPESRTIVIERAPRD